ncbi:hypothetical protein DFH09DRAFT_1377181 [Mycena vulgaris]|nr:hypothetical protein DFH09DRAFT_1377181 [Mycena vulgaris]
MSLCILLSFVLDEFLGLFLDTLEEELLALAPAVAPPPTPTPAVVEAEEPPEAQDGWLEVGHKNGAVVGWWAGQKESAIIEAWCTLRLDIQRDAIHTIQDALSFIAHPQVVQMGATDASLQILIAALPPVIGLHVKRFYCDAAAGVIKLAKHVAFGPELEIGGEVLAPTATTTGRKPVRYKLFAAVFTFVWHGVSAAGGHPMLDVLRAARGARVARLEARLEELEASADVRNITSSRDNTLLGSGDVTAIYDVCGDEMAYSACWSGDPDQEEGREPINGWDSCGAQCPCDF